MAPCCQKPFDFGEKRPDFQWLVGLQFLCVLAFAALLITATFFVAGAGQQEEET